MSLASQDLGRIMTASSRMYSTALWRRMAATLLAFAAIALLLAASPLHADVLLDANFDNEAVNQAIPLGGPALGEPIGVDDASMAFVRHAAFSTPSLQITDPSTVGAKSVTFEFLNSAEIGTGRFKVSFRLRFAALGNYTVTLREQGSDAQSFLDIVFTQDGFYLFGAAGFGTYDTTNPMAIELVFDMDQRTYNASIDGNAVVQGAALGGSISRGIGRLHFGNSFDSDTSGDFNLDDLRVETIPDRIFKDGFGDP